MSGPHVSSNPGYTFVEWTKLLGKISPDCKLAPVRTLKELYILNALADESGIGQDEFLVGVFKDPHLALDCKTFGDRKGCLSNWNTFFGPVPYKDALWSKHTGYVLQPDGEPEEGSAPATIATVGGEYPTMSDNSAQKRYRFAATLCECDAHSKFGDLPNFNVYNIDYEANTQNNIVSQTGLTNVGGIVAGVFDVINQIGASNYADISTFIGGNGSDVTDTNIRFTRYFTIIRQMGLFNFLFLRILVLDAAAADTDVDFTGIFVTNLITQFGEVNVAFIEAYIRGGVTDGTNDQNAEILNQIGQWGFDNFATIYGIGDSTGDNFNFQRTGGTFNFLSVANVIQQAGVVNIAFIRAYLDSTPLADMDSVSITEIVTQITQFGGINVAGLIVSILDAAVADTVLDFDGSFLGGLVGEFGGSFVRRLVNALQSSITDTSSSSSVVRVVNYIGQEGVFNFAVIIVGLLGGDVADLGPNFGPIFRFTSLQNMITQNGFFNFASIVLRDANPTADGVVSPGSPKRWV